MRERRATKRALLTSIMALVMCVVMLVGTTFAWFTDTATANVNTIKAGNLKLGLEMATAWDADGKPIAWADARGETLSFLRMKDDGTVEQNADILWEPGATYRLPELRVSNAGNLNLKYKVQITGIETNRTPTSTANLNDVIDWTITYVGTPLAAGSDEYVLNANETNKGVIKISGTMKTSANNDYQGLSIDGVAVTVYATQMTGEYDSSKDNYDKGAQYPVYAAAAVEVNASGETINEVKLVSGETHSSGNPVAAATVPAGAKVDSGTTQLELVIEDAETPANFTVSNTQIAPKTLDISMNGLDAANDQLIKVEFYIEEGLQNVELFHNSSLMTACSALVDVDDDQEFYYDSATGLVTMLTKTFSPFTYTSDKVDWDENTAAEYATPVDTVNKVVTIASAEELALFAKQLTTDKVNYSNYTVNIVENIDLGEGFWKPINSRDRLTNTTINGNGHTISNMTVHSCTNTSGYGAGFIGDTSGAITIKDVAFSKANVTFGYNDCWGNIGGIVMGYTYGTTLFENVSVTDSTIWGYGKIGCLLGMGADPGVKVAFKNCVSQNNTIHAAYDIGGLAGNIQRGNGVDNATVENCTVENISVVYDSNDTYEMVTGTSTFKSNDRPSGTDVTKEISGKYLVESGYYWCAYGDYYVSYGNSSYDAPVVGYTMKLANSEYPVNE